MYKIFVNEQLIILSDVVDEAENYCKVFNLLEDNLFEVIDKLKKQVYKKVCVYHDVRKDLLPIFIEKVGCRVAGGGLVVNDKDELLFIKRNKKWDLPKGGVEKGEGIEEASIREVEEETGVQDVHIVNFLHDTYHIYKFKGRYKLKLTHWYLMRTSYDGPLIPQQEEGITQALWKTAASVTRDFKNTYSNVEILVKKYFNTLD